MTVTAARLVETSPAPGGHVPWPADDILVLRGRPLRLGTGREQMSRFGDDLWHLHPAHPDAHAATSPIRWQRFPSQLRRAFKAFFFAALDQPYPVGPGGQRAGQQPSVATFHYWVADLAAFAAWLDDRRITRLCDVTAAGLDSYRGHVLATDRAAARKADMLAVIRTLWLYRSLLPAECRLPAYPWPGLGEQELVRVRFRDGSENKTPRIAPQTMEALLAWALTMIEAVGPDIRDAWRTFRELDICAHPSQEAYAGLTRPDRLEKFLDATRRSGGELPGRPGGGVNFGHILRLTGTAERDRGGLSAGQRRMITGSGIPVAAGTYVGAIGGQVAGRRWRERPVTVPELPTLLRMLYAAGFTAICYLSGMRPGEVLNLPRGCRGTDEQTGELLVYGRRGKGYDRSPLAGGADPGRPWVAVAPVHAAIGLLEELSDGPLLFPASATCAHRSRPGHANARRGNAMITDISDFISWVNATFTMSGSAPPIPPDPAGHIYGTRLRRTLAHFIVRQPRGLIATALQYGHVSTKVTLSYAGRADTSWLDDLAVEKLEMVLDQAQQDMAGLRDGEHVSGPSAAEYRTRVERAAAFAGRTVTGVRNAARMLASADPDIHHGEAMTCVWRAETAACRAARLSAGLPGGDAPDESECRSSCANLAYTDRDIAVQREHAARLAAAAADPLSPAPLRDRAAAQAARVQAVLDRHDRSRTSEPAPGQETTA